jgi:hypothetical protein
MNHARRSGCKHSASSTHNPQCTDCKQGWYTTHLTKSPTSIFTFAPVPVLTVVVAVVLLEPKGRLAVKLLRGLRAYKGVLKKDSRAGDSLARAVVPASPSSSTGPLDPCRAIFAAALALLVVVTVVASVALLCAPTGGGVKGSTDMSPYPSCCRESSPRSSS